jgi:hypothetical protein
MCNCRRVNRTKFLLYPPRNYWPDVSQILSESRRVDPTTLFGGMRKQWWRSKVVQPLLGFSWEPLLNNWGLHMWRRLNWQRCCSKTARWTRDVLSSRPLDAPTHSLFVSLDLVCPATTRNKRPFHNAFMSCSKSSDTTCQLTQIKERDRKLPWW